MLTTLLLPILLSGCGLMGETEPTTPEIEKPAGAVPDKASLAFYCDFMYNLNPADLNDVPAEERQSLMAEKLSAAAKEAGVNGWATFHTNLKARSSNDRQEWIEYGVQEHGLQQECIAARARKALNPDEQKALREQRMKLMKTVNDVAKEAPAAAQVQQAVKEQAAD